MKRMLAALALSAVITASPAFADPEVVATTVKGDPGLKSIEVLTFAPGGVLLIGDGRGSQVIAVTTGDTKPSGKRFPSAKIASIDGKLAGRIGVAAKDVDILDMAVNPASGRVYFALRRQDDKSNVILTLDAAGVISDFPLADVEHARIPLPKPLTRITDVAWAGGRVLAAARASDEFASKIFVCPGPIRHDAKGAVFSAETYHVSHRRWETKAPMSVLMPFEEDGRLYVVGAFSCTPVVKYPVDDLKPGAKVKGISMIELGSGNRPLDMFSYKKDGKPTVLVNTFRFHHEKRPFGPSPYWAAAFDRDLLAGNEKVNEKAVRRLGKGYKPATDRIRMAESFHGVVQMDRLSDETALVLRKNGEGLDLESIALP